MLELKHFAVGVDIECIERFRNYVEVRKRLSGKVFTPQEIRYCFSKPHVAQHLAVRFAAKEATIKALSNLGREGILYRDIEIVNKGNSVPVVKMRRANWVDVLITLSLSHCQDHVVAMVVVADRVKSINKKYR